MREQGGVSRINAAIQKHSSKALFAPYPACAVLHDKNTVYAVTVQNRGLWRVSVGILKSGKAAFISFPISNRNIAAGGYPVISGGGESVTPLLIPKRKAIFPRKIGAMSVQVQIFSRKISDTLLLPATAVLQGYISNRTFKRS